MKEKTLLLAVMLAFSGAAVAQTSAGTPPPAQSMGSSQATQSSEQVIQSNGPAVAGWEKQPSAVNSTEARLAKEVRHELLMLPYYSLFDDLEFTVQGRTVILSGAVTSQHGETKDEAEKAVKKIEGVENVVNNIKVLPPSTFDEQIRERVYRKLVATGGLSRYFWESAPSIHIIVENSRVTLKGFVDGEGDKNLAGITARTIPGVLNVTNELRVVK